jgi:hypothetical protein
LDDFETKKIEELGITFFGPEEVEAIGGIG